MHLLPHYTYSNITCSIFFPIALYHYNSKLSVFMLFVAYLSTLKAKLHEGKNGHLYGTLYGIPL